MYRKTAKKLLKFIEKSPTAFQAVTEMTKRLDKEGFEELKEEDHWKLKKGGNYYVTRNHSAIIAFSIPQKPVWKFHIMASHSDSPSLKIKENPEIEVENAYIKLNVERYGGMILSPWFDRPLSVAGRLIVCQNGKIREKMVAVDRDLLVIPNLAIHMNREVNDGYKYNVQKDMLPLFSDKEGKGRFMETVAEAAEVKKEDILACKNARQVLLNQSDDSLRGRDGQLQLDGLAVELEQEGQWKVIHHFLWNGNPGFRGTEAVQINPAYQELNGGWTSQGKLTGQVLYDKDGTSYTADYKILQDENYDTGMNAFFYGSQQNASIFAEFSLPRSGENCRGYVAYEIKAKESDWWIDSWLNYTHQKTIWQYPVISAAQNRRQGGWLDERVFSTVQDALQVLPEGENEGSIGS